MAEKLHINTTGYVISINGVQRHVTQEEYEQNRQTQIALTRNVQIRETAVRQSVHGEGANTEANIRQVRSGQVQATEVTASASAATYDPNDFSHASVQVARGKDAVTDLAATYSRSYGEHNPPGFFQRLGHLVSALIGSDHSAYYYGTDGSRLPVPQEVQSGGNKAKKIDYGRSAAFDDIHDQLQGTPGVHLTPDSQYDGNETWNKFFEQRPAVDPYQHHTGTVLGHRTSTYSYDGVPAALHHQADVLANTFNLTPSEAMYAVQNLDMSYTDGVPDPGFLNNLPAPSNDSGGITYFRGGNEISESDYYDK